MSDELVRWKREAAEQAVRTVRDGMVIGLGTGSTSELAIQALGERVQAGLQIVGVPTSIRSEELAGSLGIPLADIQDVDRIDLTIDGADEILPGTLTVLKGRGGALLREKLVAIASLREVIIADDTKLVEQIGSRFPVPVEVVPFGWRLPRQQIEALGGKSVLRPAEDGQSPYITDNHNYILDVDFGPIADPAGLASQIKAIHGVVDHGLFIDLISEAIICGSSGIQNLTRER